jgi:hypothetical protein
MLTDSTRRVGRARLRGIEMKCRANFSSLVATAVVAGALGSPTARAQTTPGAIPNPGTYQGSMQLQQEQDRQSQQLRQQSQQYQPQQQPQSYDQGMSPQSSNSRGTPDCLDRLARRPELAPLAQKVYLAHPSVRSSALFDIQYVPTATERPLLLKWLAGRRSCEPELAKIKDAANWSVKARRADDLSAQITNDMIVQLAEGKLTYGQFNHQRAMNAIAVNKIP